MAQDIAQEKQQLVQVLGQRMKIARELCGFSQLKAAELLGYANSSKLAKVENASDTNSVPLWLIPKAAEVYNVSSDFLIGISDQWQRNPAEAKQAYIQSLLEQSRACENSTVQRLYNHFSNLDELATSIASKAGEIKAALDRFQERNPIFLDMPMGAKLHRLIHEANREAALALKK